MPAPEVIYEVEIGDEYIGMDESQALHLTVMGHVTKTKIIHTFECVAPERDVLEELGLS